jgi:hypothetical protein
LLLLLLFLLCVDMVVDDKKTVPTVEGFCFTMWMWRKTNCSSCCSWDDALIVDVVSVGFRSTHWTGHIEKGHE